MADCLGIYLDNNIIKYAKVTKDSDNLKMDAYGVKFYDDLQKTIDQIIKETYSFQTPISINIAKESYTYSQIFNMLNKKDWNKAIDTEFDYFCSEKGKNKNALEYRTIESQSIETTDKTNVMYVYTDKSNIIETTKNVEKYRISNISPISVTIPKLAKYKETENVAIVNIEKTTEVTVLLKGKIAKVDKIPKGMNSLLSSIAEKENSEQKAYEICKNTTIYTKIGQNLQGETNPYLEDIITDLYEIIQEVKKIINESLIDVDTIYITGLATVINNIDLFFQENFLEKKCEILTPYFANRANVKINIKDYIEVNSAIALAIQGLEKAPQANFQNQKMSLKNLDWSKIKEVLNQDVGSSKGSKTKVSIKQDLSSPLDTFDKILLRLVILIILVMIIYTIFTKITIQKLDKTIVEADAIIVDTNTKIEAIKSYTTQVNNKTSEYQELLDKLQEVADRANLANASQKIPNLLYEIMFAIPTDVQILSIENTTGTHVVIKAQAEEYAQLGIFKAILTTEGILTNVTSSSGEKQSSVISVQIEGDLP